MSSLDTEESATAALETARAELLSVDREMNILNQSLDRLTRDTQRESNSLKLSVIKVLGLPKDAKPTFTIQLSSPIESQSISRIHDPLHPTQEGSFVEFVGVETTVATILITLQDQDIFLGTSAYFDVSPLCDSKVKVSELEVAIVPEDGNVTAGDSAVASPSSMNQDDSTQEGGDEDKGKEEEGQVDSDRLPTGKKAGAEATNIGLLDSICTVLFRVQFEPSNSDQKRELYELKSRLASRREAAIDNLRKCAATLNRMKTSDAKASSGAITKNPSPAVKSGFLNTKKEKKKDPFFLVRWYQRTLGPESLIRQLFPIFKNYIIFFGGVALMHFQGQQLALPPPV